MKEHHIINKINKKLKISEEEVKSVIEDAMSSDRNAVLIMASVIDYSITQLIPTWIKMDEDRLKEYGRLTSPNSNGALSGLSVRVDLAYILGAYKKNVKDDIKRILKIRNDFAHLGKVKKLKGYIESDIKHIHIFKNKSLSNLDDEALRKLFIKEIQSFLSAFDGYAVRPIINYKW